MSSPSRLCVSSSDPNGAVPGPGPALVFPSGPLHTSVRRPASQMPLTSRHEGVSRYKHASRGRPVLRPGFALPLPWHQRHSATHSCAIQHVQPQQVPRPGTWPPGHPDWLSLLAPNTNPWRRRHASNSHNPYAAMDVDHSCSDGRPPLSHSQDAARKWASRARRRPPPPTHLSSHPPSHGRHIPSPASCGYSSAGKLNLIACAAISRHQDLPCKARVTDCVCLRPFKQPQTRSTPSTPSA